MTFNGGKIITPNGAQPWSVSFDDAELARLRTALGGSAPTPTPNPVPNPNPNPNPAPAPTPAGFYTEYNGGFFGNKRFTRIDCDAAGNPIGEPYPAYISKAMPDGQGAAQWGGTIERYAIINGWFVVLGYEDISNGNFYPVELIRADWRNLDTGEYTDISNLLGRDGTPKGQPVVPNAMYASGRFQGRFWFWVHNSLTGGRSQPAFHLVRLEYGKVVTNPSWHGDANRSRLSLIWQEAWWDQSGWIDRGQCPVQPWKMQTTDAGVPAVWTPFDPGEPVFTGHDTLGRGAGSLWQYQYSTYRCALYSIENS